jgi:hypothetical protein
MEGFLPTRRMAQCLWGGCFLNGLNKKLSLQERFQVSKLPVSFVKRRYRPSEVLLYIVEWPGAIAGAQPSKNRT